MPCMDGTRLSASSRMQHAMFAPTVCQLISMEMMDEPILSGAEPACDSRPVGGGDADISLS